MAAEDGVEIPKRYKAAVYDDPGKISTKIETLDTPEPGPGEVLLKLYVMALLPFFFRVPMMNDMSPYYRTYRAHVFRLPHRTHSGVCHSDMGIMENSVTIFLSFPPLSLFPLSSARAPLSISQFKKRPT